MISNEARDRVRGRFAPIAIGLGRLGLTPDALTVIGFAITAIGAILVAQQQWLAGGLVVFVGGLFDLFDGTLARATGRASRWGAFLDSTLDKAGEIVVFLGIIAGLQSVGVADGPLLAALAMASALMVSYTRARAEGLGYATGRGMASIGLMAREVRLVVVTLGLVGAGALGTTPVVTDANGAGGAAFPPGIYVLFGALGIIALGSIITSIQRILHVRDQAHREAASSPTARE
jgi:phosphatidylglycerophosphate synthase